MLTSYQTHHCMRRSYRPTYGQWRCQGFGWGFTPEAEIRGQRRREQWATFPPEGAWGSAAKSERSSGGANHFGCVSSPENAATAALCCLAPTKTGPM